MRSILTTFFIIGSLLTLFGQSSNNVFVAYEDTLAELGPEILNGRNDSVKFAANYKFISILTKALKTPNSFEYPFDKLITIAKLSPNDNTFRIFNWNLAKEDGTYQYFCILQAFNKRFDRYQIFNLNDQSVNIKNPENASLTAQDWYGAHYFRLIGIKKRRNKYYTLLGWDGNNRLSTKKIIDVLYFGAAGEPKFGKQVLEAEAGYRNRLIFEYNAQAVMSIKFYENARTIVFDHISPTDPSLKGIGAYQGPDGTYDALKFKRGKWEYLKNFDARNMKTKKKEKYQTPE